MREFCHAVADWAQGQGAWAPILFVLLYACATLLAFFPTSLITFAAGAIFGVVWGTVLVSIGSTLGATLCFLLGRYALRDWVARKIATVPRFAAVEAALARDGWKIVGLLRMSPLFPYPVLNYGLGLTSVRLRHYVLASWLGMLPTTCLCASLGSLAGKAATEGRIPPAQWLSYGIAIAATILATVHVTRVARRELAK